MFLVWCLGMGFPIPWASSAPLITHPMPHPVRGPTGTPCSSLACVCQWHSFLSGPHTLSSSSPSVSLTFYTHVSENLPSLIPSRPLPQGFMDPVPTSAEHSSYHMDMVRSYFSLPPVGRLVPRIFWLSFLLWAQCLQQSKWEMSICWSEMNSVSFRPCSLTLRDVSSSTLHVIFFSPPWELLCGWRFSRGREVRTTCSGFIAFSA